jgi:hypothetical protein
MTTDEFVIEADRCVQCPHTSRKRGHVTQEGVDLSLREVPRIFVGDSYNRPNFMATISNRQRNP